MDVRSLTTMTEVILLFGSSGCVIATLLVIVQTNVVHALIYLVLSLLSVAVVFFSLGAPFVAILEAIVYAARSWCYFVCGNDAQPRTTKPRSGKRLEPSARTWFVPSVLAAALLMQLTASFPSAQTQIKEIGARAVSELLVRPHCPCGGTRPFSAVGRVGFGLPHCQKID